MLTPPLTRTDLHTAGLAGARVAQESSGFFNDEDVSWMVEPVLDHLLQDGWQTSLAGKVKMLPPLASAAEKRALGINTRLKVGNAFALSLSEAGRQDPNEAAKTISSLIAGRIQNLATIAHARHREALLWIETDEYEVCKAPMPLQDGYFTVDAIPGLTGAACEKKECQCLLHALVAGSAVGWALETAGEELGKQLIGTRPDPHAGKRFAEREPASAIPLAPVEVAEKLAVLKQAADETEANTAAIGVLMIVILLGLFIAGIMGVKLGH